MTLFTGKGDRGDTGLFGCKQRISKSSVVAEALGTVDELNSLLGLVRSKAIGETAALLEGVQQNLFIVQAALAGADKALTPEKVAAAEKVINAIEPQLPPIKSFLVPGGTELAALLDYARTVARRAERRVVAASSDKPLAPATLAYLNRLSSLLYALARLENHKSGIKESAPRY